MFKIGLTFNWQKAGITSIPIGYRIQVPYGDGGHHYITGGLSEKTLWNPGNTTGISEDEISVYVYARNKR